MRTVYVDLVRFTDGATDEEMRDYAKTQHTDTCFVWIWSDGTVRIPMHRVRDIVTSEE